jgi:putative hemolysin
MSERLLISVTRDPGEIRAAQALRHAVFVVERGAAPTAPGLEADPFDPVFDHVIVRDAARPERGVVATARVAAGAAYTGREFDLSPLAASGRPLCEMGRICLHPDYRGGVAAWLLLRAALDHLRARGRAIAVGTGSFPGADPARHLPALRALRAAALAPERMRPRATGPEAIEVRGAAPSGAMREVPALIKGYVRAGAWIGEGAWLDRAFNTVDVCLVLDLDRLRLPAALQAERAAA